MRIGITSAQHMRKIIAAAKNLVSVSSDSSEMTFAIITTCLLRAAPLDWLCDFLDSVMFDDVREILDRGDFEPSHLNEIPMRAPADYR